jgi:curved DNA-binding protein CbpA
MGNQKLRGGGFSEGETVASTTMGTLYDLLGALPDDNAEGLRTAFRKAAKATHPDINPDDPDASLRFRQLVRAHDILSDEEQRSTYDLLLTVALREPGPDPKRARIYQTIYKHASNTLAATLIAGMLIGSYALFEHVSKTAAVAEKAIEIAAPRPAEVADMIPAGQPDASGRDEAADKPESVEIPAAVIVASAVTPAASPPVIPNAEPVAKPAMADAKSYRERGMVAYRDGNLNRALADFDRAIQRDPNFADAYIDRSIVLYRMRELNRAFADIAQAKRIGSSGRTKTSAAAAPAAALAPRRLSPARVRDTVDY